MDTKLNYRDHTLAVVSVHTAFDLYHMHRYPVGVAVTIVVINMAPHIRTWILFVGKSYCELTVSAVSYTHLTLPTIYSV